MKKEMEIYDRPMKTNAMAITMDKTNVISNI